MAKLHIPVCPEVGTQYAVVLRASASIGSASNCVRSNDTFCLSVDVCARAHRLALRWTCCTMRFALIYLPNMAYNHRDRHYSEDNVTPLMEDVFNWKVDRNPSPFSVLYRREWIKPCTPAYLTTYLHFIQNKHHVKLLTWLGQIRSTSVMSIFCHSCHQNGLERSYQSRTRFSMHLSGNEPKNSILKEQSDLITCSALMEAC